ncbi:tRNA dimethylallyltransferase [Balamuthia mandrillaris]
MPQPSQKQEEHEICAVVVLGCTGTGKSRLAIQLAKALQGEVISADSMQVYKGFHIATAKVTQEEMEGVPHHLLDFVEPTDTSFNVSSYCRLALPLVEELAVPPRCTLPIIAGGTNYYLEGLLWQDSLLFPDATATATTEIPLDKRADSTDLLRELAMVDPVMAERLHPEDHRKIANSLHVFKQTGKKHSELLRQKPKPTLRFPTCFLWIDCKMDVLDARLDRRVDTMMENGLLKEVEQLQDLFLQKGIHLDYSSGILQSIGYKEFAPYFQAKSTMKETQEDELNAILRECVAALKRRTRRYAKTQRAWIRNKFLPRTPIFLVDSTRLDQWDEQVLNPALHFVQEWHAQVCNKQHHGKNLVEFFAGLSVHAEKLLLPFPGLHPPMERDQEERGHKRAGEEEEDGLEGQQQSTGFPWKIFTCQECNGRKLRGIKEWEAHIRSRSHRRHRQKKTRRNNTNQGDVDAIKLATTEKDEEQADKTEGLTRRN